MYILMHTFVTDIPSVNLDSLLIQLRPQISAKWYQFGEAAGIDNAVLDSFVKSCSPDDCLVEMLDYWLRKSPRKLTWRDVAGVLKVINYLQMANDIERVYETGTYCIVGNFRGRKFLRISRKRAFCGENFRGMLNQLHK
jgi:hypothetical protein